MVAFRAAELVSSRTQLPRPLRSFEHDDAVALAKGKSSLRQYAYSADLLRSDGTLQRKAELLRRVMVEDMGLKARDIVAAFSKDARLGFDLSIRKRAVLLSLGKDGPAIFVGRECAWIVPRGTRARERIGELISRQFLEVARQEVSPSSAVSTRRAGQHVAGGQQEAALVPLVAMAPFALIVTEAILVLYLERLKANLQRIIAESARLLDGFGASGAADISTFQLELLRRTKQQLDFLKGQAESLKQALFDAVGDEDDMDQLVEAVGAAREEWELCFEYYSHSAEEIGVEAFRQLEALEDLETSMSLSLSSRRLELEKLAIYLEVIGSGLSLGALLTGAFGMNLMSGLENKRFFFWPVCAGIAVTCGALCAFMRTVINRRLRRQSASALWVPRMRARRGL